MLFILCILFFICYRKFDYWNQIVYHSHQPDFTKWVLCDKYIAKQYASLNGFKVPETYQLCQYPHQIKVRDTCVVKPVDLCDSHGVYLLYKGMDVKTKKPVCETQIQQELHHIRSTINQEYYMTETMYNGRVPFTGYIVEEYLHTKDGTPPSDYKCYVFNGRILCIAHTSGRKTVNGKQIFQSSWYTRDWNAIRFPMIQKNYHYHPCEKPQGYDLLIKLVEAMSKKLQRHCRIDVYLHNGHVYFGEFTFFGGAFLHTFPCNLFLGVHWYLNPDNLLYEDPVIPKLIPPLYQLI